MMKDFFYGIEDLFVNVLFVPYDFFRFMHGWWSSNAVNWIFLIVGISAFVYWMLQLKHQHDRGEEDQYMAKHPNF